MSRRAAFLIAIAACGVIGWVGWTLLTKAPEDDRRETSHRAPPSDTTAAVPAPAPIEAASRTSEGRVEPIEGKRFTDSPTPAAGAGSQPARRAKKLYVVLAPDDAPAAGATVDFIGIDSTSFSIDGLATMFDDPESAASGKPTRLTADPDGVVLLPRFKGAAVVRGRSGDLVGSTTIFLGALGRATLRLAPPLRILVVDASRTPRADVPVAVVSRTGWGVIPEQRGLTGADGIAHLIAPAQGDAWTAPEGKQFASIAIPLAQPVEEPLDPGKLPTDPVRLVLPETGRVTVKLVRPDGFPFLDAATVSIAPKDDANRRIVAGAPFGTSAARAANGVASFPFVGLEPVLAVRAVPDDERVCAAEGTIDGPRRAETTLPLSCGKPAILVTGRILRAGGKVLQHGRLEARLPGHEEAPAGPPVWQNRSRSTDGEGRFRLHFDVDPASLTAGDLELKVFDDPALFGPGSGGVKSRSQIVRLPDSVRTGAVDIGDVVIEDLDVLVAGAVITKEGTPIGPARMVVMERAGRGWEQAWGAHDVHDGARADGRFELRGKIEGDDLGLIATCEGWICVDPVPFERGARDVKVVMTRAGGLQGSIKGLGSKESGWASDAPLRVFVTGPNARVTARNLPYWRRQDGRLDLMLISGKFKTRELLPGTYGVQICPPNGEEPLFTVEGIVVVAGEINRDPRLQDIELKTLMKTRVVTVVDEAGKPIEGARVAVAPRRGEDRSFTTFTTGADGRTLVSTPAAAVDVVVAMKGYRAMTVPIASEDVTVTLRKARPRPVTIRLDEATPIPSPPLFIEAQLAWLSGLDEPLPKDTGSNWGDPRSRGMDQKPFGQDRTITVMVETPGVYSVHLWLIQQTIEGRGGGGLEQKGGNATVTVGEEGTASLTVTPDPEDLKRSIERANK